MVMAWAWPPAAETAIVSPILAWAARRVRAPSAISRLVLGRRPDTGAGTNDAPPGSGSTIASACTGPISSGAPDQAVVQAATCGSRRIAARAGRRPPPAVLLSMASQVTP